MNKKLSNIQGMRVPKYSQNELKSKLSKDDLWEFLVNVYPDAIKHDVSTDKEISIVIDVQSGEQQSNSFVSKNSHMYEEAKNWIIKRNQVKLANPLI